MGSRGPSPTPKELLKLRGSWRGDVGDGQFTPQMGKPAAPKYLTARGKSCWRYMVKHLDNMGVLAMTDRNALARYCHLYARWRDAVDHVTQFGDVDDGKERVQAKREITLSEQLLKLEREFGLTPSARARIANTVEDKPKDDDNADRERIMRIVG
jgi:P27 family predicted phage terminase small subunit